MGLDMYLVKFPRIQGATVKQMCATLTHYKWFEYKQYNPEDTTTFEDWSGYTKEDIPEEPLLSEIRSCFRWNNNVFFNITISEHNAYWRKCYYLHNWFVERFQDGIDDCEYHKEVNKAAIIKLRNIFDQLTVDPDYNKVINYFPDFQTPEHKYNSEKSEWQDEFKNNYEQFQKVLDTTNFEKEQIYYLSSW